MRGTNILWRVILLYKNRPYRLIWADQPPLPYMPIKQMKARLRFRRWAFLAVKPIYKDVNSNIVVPKNVYMV